MGLGDRIGWGIVIYAMVFLTWAGVSVYGWTSGIGPRIAEVAMLIFVCLWAGSQLKFRTWVDILPYSFGWAAIAAALDALLVVPLTGWGWYEMWPTWVGYALVVILPLFAPMLRMQKVPHGVWES